MRTKFIIPVIDTESGKFEYNGRTLTREEFSDMEYEHFLRTNKQVAMFVDNMARGISNFDSHRMKDYKDEEHPDIIYNFEEIEGIVLDSKKYEVTEEYFDSQVERGKMFILNINFNPNSLTGEGESETRFWLKESKMILSDKTISEELRLRTLPDRYFWVVINEKAYLLNKCKIVQDYSNKKFPLNFAIIVEKVTYDGRK